MALHLPRMGQRRIRLTVAKRTAVIALTTIGILSGLLLALFLPVLVWSPPWAERGFYYNNDKRDTCYFEGGTLTGYTDENHPRYSIHCRWNGKKNAWVATFGNKLNEKIHVQVKPNRSDLLYGENVYRKIYNPFAIWHIKWLEWTN